MDLSKIRELLKIVSESGVAEVEIEVDEHTKLQKEILITDFK